MKPSTLPPGLIRETRTDGEIATACRHRRLGESVTDYDADNIAKRSSVRIRSLLRRDSTPSAVTKPALVVRRRDNPAGLVTTIAVAVIAARAARRALDQRSGRQRPFQESTKSQRSHWGRHRVHGV